MDLETLIFQVAQPDGPRICVDSRLIRPGDVFVALSGTRVDGHDFIDQAVAAGAGVVVTRHGCLTGRGLPVPNVEVNDPNAVLGRLAQARAGEPARHLLNLAVTGTNGKTTVAILTQACLQAAGQKCGLIGTVSCNTGNQVIPASLTTPDALALADLQRQMVASGCRAMVMEASSHALDQHRIAGIHVQAAAFTNLTGDHLDYHGSEEHYLAAKARLFESLSTDSMAVLNAESPQAAILAGRTAAHIWWYGIDRETDLTARIQSLTTDGTIYQLTFKGQTIRVHSPLLGRHNVSNHLAAAGLALAAGLSLDQVARGLESQTMIPGRLERIAGLQDFTILVDYAHTDDALMNVLTTLRPLCDRRLIVLFGCGGDRDKSKRPRMAKIAEQMADEVVLTSDNPRSEDPRQIIADVQAGFARPQARTLHVEPDRTTAIGLALNLAQSGDMVLLAGKGHETYQIIGSERVDFDDRQVVRDYCAAGRI